VSPHVLLSFNLLLSCIFNAYTLFSTGITTQAFVLIQTKRLKNAATLYPAGDPIS
jgi:hypothetical protein